MNIKNLLNALCSANCAAHIKSAMEVAKTELETFSEVKIFENYLKAEIKGRGNKTLMLEAHIDQIAMIVTAVFEDGFVQVAPVGSIDSRFLPAVPVKICGKEEVKGVFTSVPPHIKNEDSVPSFDACLIDTGRNDIKSVVTPGDIAFFDCYAGELTENRFCSAGLDNRAGCAAVISSAEKIAKAGLEINLEVLLTMGEELGLRGAKVAAFESNADLAVAVDVSFGNCPDVSSVKTSPLKSGAMIGVSPILSKNIYSSLKNIAERENIPFTLEVMGGRTGTDADIISVTRAGIPTGLLSVPLRYMHTPLETVDTDDIESVSSLIFKFAEEVSKNV